MAEIATQTPETNGHTEDEYPNAAPAIPTFEEAEPEIPFNVVIDKVTHSYTLRQFELDNGKNRGGGLAQWMSNIARRNEIENGKILKTNFVDMHEDLIALCCYDSVGGRVPKETIKRWSPRAKNWAFEQCQKINGLTDKRRDELGKA